MMIATMRLEDFGNYWNTNLISFHGLWIASAAVAGIISLLALGRWLRRRASQPEPLSVFRQLAREWGVSLPEQWLLLRIARQQALPSPLTLLLSPNTLTYHGRAYAESLAIWRQGRLRQQVTDLCRRLFGTDALPPEAPEGEQDALLDAKTPSSQDAKKEKQ